MGDWNGERGFGSSILGRVDWSCWLAAVGLLFVTVISFMVQFPAMGIVTAIIAILLVAFDSWVNRPTGRRASVRHDNTGTGWRDSTGWSDVSQVDGRYVDSQPEQPVQQPVRQPVQQQRQAPPPPARQDNRPAPDFRGGQQARPNQGQPNQPPLGRPNPGQQPMRPNQGQPPWPNQGQPNQPQPTRVNQPQQPQQPTRVNQAQPPQRPPFQPAPPQPPARGREPDFRART